MVVVLSQHGKELDYVRILYGQRSATEDHRKSIAYVVVELIASSIKAQNERTVPLSTELVRVVGGDPGTSRLLVESHGTTFMIMVPISAHFK